MPHVNNGPRSRHFDRKAFVKAYDEVVIGSSFFEEPGYYRQNRDRYQETIRLLTSLPVPLPARVLEIGGGQVGLMLARLFGDDCTVADLSPMHSEAVTRFGLRFIEFDLLHDPAPAEQPYDVVILCEVIEHLPVPAHIVLSKLKKLIRPRGFLFITTPNLYRLRNVIRLALGMPVFCHFYYPGRGSFLGHPIEYSAEHLAWQIEQAGYALHSLKLVQLSNAGASRPARVARALLSPVLKALPRWRDNLVCSAHSRG